MCDPRDLNDNDALVVKAMATYMEESVSRDLVLRELLAQARHNDPTLSVEQCLAHLVQNYNRLRGKSPC